MSDAYNRHLIRLREIVQTSIHRGRLSHAQIQIEVSSASCGDQLLFEVNIHNNTIQIMRFSGSGCMLSQASAAILASYITDMPLESLRDISYESFKKLVIGDTISLGQTRELCLKMVWDALPLLCKEIDARSGKNS